MNLRQQVIDMFESILIEKYTDVNCEVHNFWEGFELDLSDEKIKELNGYESLEEEYEFCGMACLTDWAEFYVEEVEELNKNEIKEILEEMKNAEEYESGFWEYHEPNSNFL